MQWLNNLIRPDLLKIAEYSSSSSEAAGAIASIEIDANENPWPPYGEISSLCKPNRYIDHQQPPEFLARLGATWGIAPDWLMIGRGSDEGIDMLTRLLCQAGRDQILICPPTFAMYAFSAQLQGAEVIEVPLNSEWQLDVPAIVAACTPRTRMIFIPSPNAPMGHKMRTEDIIALCKARAQQGFVVVDEAYVGFAEDSSGMIQMLSEHENLVILRTLSKTHSMAGERIGGVIARPELIRCLRKILAPYPLPQSAVRCGLDALSPNGLVQSAEQRRILVDERERMAKLLLQSPFVTKIYPSVTNFLLIEVKDVNSTMQLLMKYGILARNRHKLVPNTIRITVSKPDENDIVLKVLGVTLPSADKIRMPRLFSARRKTKETSIDVTVNLDAPNFLKVESGIGFLDHMVSQLAAHGGFGLELHCKGDLHIDQHHTIEDCALALGEAIKGALADKRGIARFAAPLDESVAQVVLDLSGRPFCSFNGGFAHAEVGAMRSEMIPHFFQSLANSLTATLHITLTGDNDHHKAEACFKAVGRALRQAFRRDGDAIPSTKGTL